MRTVMRPLAALAVVVAAVVGAPGGGGAVAAGTPEQARPEQARPEPARPEQARLEQALQQRLLTGVGVRGGDREGEDLMQLGRFYDGRASAPVWIENGRPSPRAHLLYAALAAAAEDGLDPRRYGVQRLGALLEHGDSPDALAELEVLLSRGALLFGRDLAAGRLDPSRIDPELIVERQEPDPQELLRRVAEAADPGGTVRAMAPARPEYRRLREALAAYRTLAAAGGWPAVPTGGETLKPGQGDPRVPALRARLAATGELPQTAPAPADPQLYDPALEAAVRLFQRRNGLEPDGAVGRQTVVALNVTARQRVTQIEINMERWRWLPADLGPSYLIVNLAAFDLAVFEGDRPVHTARIVVGAPFTRTPVFSESMTYLELNPYWNVPPTIARDEIFPKARKDPGYLARHGYELLSDWSETAVPVDPATVDWRHGSLNRYKVRQKPGDTNSLGRIKFMFPNRFNVYLHDTPSKRLFERANRTFSHGCMRVENPLDLAETVLRLTGTAGWDRARLDAAIAGNQRQVVRLRRPLPVHVTYVTAFVEEDGTVAFRPDIYGRDATLAAALAAPQGRQQAAPRPPAAAGKGGAEGAGPVAE
ncbi:L,D-transpeptidase family protein [Rhodocista pekingensis]|uniref:Murein L,D-transpeptidase n=1 Tax=Rhodocista pekingensis TaxID=201185 RepID=A0ABW2KV14_9PROT